MATAQSGMSTCPICFETLGDAKRPAKKLRCQHYFCLRCLQKTKAQSGFVRCSLCKEEYGDLKLETLETWMPGNDSSVIPCHACKRKGITQEAVIHCPTCSQSYCTKHQEFHEETQDHVIVQIQEYQAQTEKYSRRTCELPEHEGRFIEVGCPSCAKVFCTKCFLEQSLCENGGQHCFKSLDDIRPEMNEWIAEVSGKLNSLCESVGVSVKDSSRNLTELQQEVDKINCQLDEALARKITELTEITTRMKSQVAARLQSLTSIIDVHVNQCQESLTLLERSISDCEALRKKHTADVLREWNHKRDLFMAALDESQPRDITLGSLGLEFLEHGPIVANSLGELREVQHLPGNPTNVAIPKDIIPAVELTTREAVSQISEVVYSVNFGGDGSLVAAGDNGLFTLSTEFTLTSHQPAPPQVRSACLDETGILISGTVTDQIRVGSNKTRQWAHPSRNFGGRPKHAQLAVTNNRILMAAPTKNAILIYNYNGRKERRVRLQGMERPQFISCLDEHSIIVTSPCQSKVCKFPLLHPESVAEWVCGTLVGPTGVCADHLGLIYVCNGALGNKQITVLSPQGELLKSFGLGVLPSLVEEMTVRRDDRNPDRNLLAVAGRDEGVKLFYITF